MAGVLIRSSDEVSRALGFELRVEARSAAEAAEEYLAVLAAMTEKEKKNG